MNRREYLKAMGAGTAAIMAGTSWTRCSPRPSRSVTFKHGTWIGSHVGNGTSEEWKRKFAELRSAGIDSVLLKVEPEDYQRLIAVADAEGIELHAWIIAMMQGGMESEHHEWYVVNRNEESAADKPAYVDYYKFMCPSREPVRQHLRAQVDRLSKIDGLKSVHLDYIRYPDVILPISLWPKYGVVQDREYPEFDYCYCEVCRKEFREQSGVDPLTLEDPSQNLEWVQYRYDSITRVVNMLADVAHGHDMPITAAVFPTPEIAKKLVRQDWVNWNLDAVMPMIYHSFYEEPVAWIEDATRQGVDALAGRIPLYSGVFVPELNPDELADAVRYAESGGARGVILFEGKMPTAEHWDAFSKAVKA